MGFAMAIDGPAGAGKSTIAKIVAEKLELNYIDTGAMYRAIAYYMYTNSVDTDDITAVENACANINIDVEYTEQGQQMIINKENITSHLREEAVGKLASKVAKLALVRSKLVNFQRQLAASSRIVMDGRDIGTCVLPDAQLKIYLTASVEVRAKRRYDELVSKNETCDYEIVKKDIADRDYEDMHRDISPLKQADDAILLDTSDMSINEVADNIIRLYEERING